VGELKERLRVFAEDLNHPEGVTWNPFDGLVYAGGENGEFYSVTLDGKVELRGTSGGSMLGLCVDGNGLVYACDTGKGEIARLDPSTGKVETYARGVDGGTLDTPNVAAFDAEGNLYVTCSGEEGNPSIVKIAPGGETAVWTLALPGYPNGAVVSPDGGWLYVVEAKAERIARVPILEDGSAGEPETFASLPDTDADGITMDSEGSLWTTLYRPDGIVRVASDGSTELVIDDHLASTLDAPTNIAFAGEHEDLAVIANVGSRHLSAVDFGVSGQTPFYPKVS
jgi:sugar lactone lactonase YvrE